MRHHPGGRWWKSVLFSNSSFCGTKSESRHGIWKVKKMKWRIKAINAVVLVVHDVKVKGKETNTAESCRNDGSVPERRTKREGADTESVHNVMPSAKRFHSDLAIVILNHFFNSCRVDLCR
ncbi:hypothetical protein TNCV_2225031 [Trichonephila clavipes]|nr:hypothetical protein TNCV_2225031 [Trichonephila clavipes]